MAASLGTLALIALLWRKSQKPYRGRAIVILSVSAIILPRAAEIALQPAKKFHMIGMLNTELLSIISGMLLGIAIAVICGVLVIRGSRRISKGGLTFLTTILLGVLLSQQLIAVIQFGFTYGFIPLIPLLLSFSAPLINSYDRFFYGLLAVFLLYPLVRVLIPSKQAPWQPPTQRKSESTGRLFSVNSGCSAVLR